jgi:nicotinate-nucleotide pyrophosphorylase (carboxylating)
MLKGTLMNLSPESIREIVARALREDVGRGDLTTLALIPAEQYAEAALVMREPGVVAGLPLLAAVFAAVDPALNIDLGVADGAAVSADAVIARVYGPARGILTGERVALNLVQRLSGIATLTARCVQAVQGTGAEILDTRKTTPGLRKLEKAAVVAGGGCNHRAGLYDMVLVKENHAALAGGITAAVEQVKATLPDFELEVECRTPEEVDEALAAGATRLLLDNMSPEELAAAVAQVDGKAKLEASGGVTLATLRSYAEAGVDWISVGALTHSAPALDLSLTLEALPTTNP